MGRKHYYFRFKPSAKVNYLYLFDLAELADYTKATGAFDTIHYPSTAKLADRFTFSKQTLDRLLSNGEYADFLSVDKENKTITLKNSFTKGNKTPFVCLTDKEVAFLRQQNDNLLCKYYIYMKYYCGLATGNQDFTTKQFLTACGYSVTSSSYIQKVSAYNKLLQEQGLIQITKYRDELGHTRNIYKLPD